MTENMTNTDRARRHAGGNPRPVESVDVAPVEKKMTEEEAREIVFKLLQVVENGGFDHPDIEEGDIRNAIDTIDENAFNVGIEEGRAQAAEQSMNMR